MAQENAPARRESDSLGSLEVPSGALWGASTQRAILNFPISGRPLDPALIHAYGLIKWAAASANESLGVLPAAQASLIRKAAREVHEGKFDAQFVVDVFQTGSGTSTHMNVNEVIANRCAQLAGFPLGAKEPVHPNDHVNLGQSSNDTFPTAIHLAAATALRRDLIPALSSLREALSVKAEAFHPVLKIGRTHLMDATPLRLGQEFSGYTRQADLAVARAEKALTALRELPLGGTAVGTGLNRHPDFPRLVIAHLSEQTGIDFIEAANPFEAQAARDALVEASGQLKTIAVSLFKIANDLRWLASGPRCGLGEISLPAIQPGSSIMPGKSNPVLCEALMQVCAQVIGNDAAITWGGANGNLELNTMMPMMAQNALDSIRLLTRSITQFRQHAVEGIEANEARCRELIDGSLSLVTSLVPHLGYEKAAELAGKAFATGRTIREICEEESVLPAETLDAALDAASMTEPRA